jgi:hypothetical protein
MHPKELPGSHAIAVTTEGIIPIKENDVVIVGVKCWIDKDGNAIPFNDKIQPFRNELNAELGKDVYLFKRLKEANNETSERNPSGDRKPTLQAAD